ncbi:hypothetical protein [Winogradskyella immobilis]|uniref:Uncharacterized protein n=1 Tax=Winogradskyella immobilis TaxID=2816852 RepID=A0ABS8ETK6_9FLAO|nr:hypothetical protein [Winogradskyella immobilis]MCC1485607.1 hypothetical protein [Winogradskyella immobilis]MCG0017699.1 hypothetical protein [Winogradskyella immobilis]
MRILYLLLFIVSVAVTSCDGRKTNQQSLTESIESFKKKNTFEEHLYIPQNYLKRETDTILSNHYSVNIKTFTDMESDILKSIKKGNINYSYHHRNIISQIHVKQNNSTVIHQSINKSFIAKYTNDQAVIDNSILQGAWLNQNLSLEDTIVIDLAYKEIDTKKDFLYQLSINKNGNIRVNRLNQNYYL